MTVLVRWRWSGHSELCVRISLARHLTFAKVREPNGRVRMIVRSLVIVFAVGALPAGAFAQNVPARFDDSLRKAKFDYDAEMELVRTAEVDRLRRQADALPTDSLDAANKKLALERRITELGLRGYWSRADSEVELVKPFGAARAKVERAYKGALSTAKAHGESQDVLRAVEAEVNAFRAASHLAAWKPLSWEQALVDLPPGWTKFLHYVLSPPVAEDGSGPTALPLRDPRADDVWFQAEFQVEGEGSFEVRALDAQHRPLVHVVTSERFAQLLREKPSIADGVTVRITMQSGAGWHARIELDGRTVAQRDGGADSKVQESWPEPAAPEVPWLAIAPRAGARVRLFPVRWRELSDVRERLKSARDEPPPRTQITARETAPGSGKYTIGVGGHKNLKAHGGSGTEQALLDALAWLRWHQSENGSWDCDGFMSNCGAIAEGQKCSDPGSSSHDVGITGLTLLAFFGDGNTTIEGRYKEQVAKGINWIREQQDPDAGSIGERVGLSFIYNHAIATLAVNEAYYFSRLPEHKNVAQSAVNFLTSARSPNGVWRYDYPSKGDGDTSITSWAVFALKSAVEAGVEVAPESFDAARTYFAEMTDPVTGRCGYDLTGGPGSRSSRVDQVNDHFPAEEGEAMSAVSLLCRIFLGDDPSKHEVLQKQAELLKKKLPTWSENPFSIDFYYWFYGSYAMFQMGGPHWESWNKAMKDALVPHQRKAGDEKGSWDARVDAWGHAGGRVYTTALGALCLETYFRYARVFETR